MIYTPENITIPFWLENSGFTGGRDALGIQNSSVTVYSKLLPGLTNLTERLRYYSFYCWLLKEYDLKYRQEEVAHHYNFFRRAELIIAYLMATKDNEQQSIVGILYARQHKDDINEKGYYDIKSGADKLGVVPIPKQSTLYWDYTSGALGQYYIGSLVNLNLVEVKEKFFFIKDKGRRLAKSFEESISEKERNYFLEFITKGKITLEDIENISSFKISYIPFKSKEWYSLKELLIKNDDENLNIQTEITSTKRRETIALYLEYKKSETHVNEFPKWIFENISPTIQADTAKFGWYYYYVNETFHAALQSLFWVFLSKLDGRLIAVNLYIKEMEKMILEESSKIFNTSETLENNIHSIKDSTVITKLDELNKANKEGDWTKSAIRSIELMLMVYKETLLYQTKIEEFENLHFINLQPGHFTENISIFIKNKLNHPYEEYITAILKRIMNLHVTSAYRKMRNGESYLLKFMVEDNMIFHIQTVFPSPTTPRIKTLEKFLKDLGFLNQSGKMTEYGIELYKELK